MTNQLRRAIVLVVATISVVLSGGLAPASAAAGIHAEPGTWTRCPGSLEIQANVHQEANRNVFWMDDLRARGLLVGGWVAARVVDLSGHAVWDFGRVKIDRRASMAVIDLGHVGLSVNKPGSVLALQVVVGQPGAKGACTILVKNWDSDVSSTPPPHCSLRCVTTRPGRWALYRFPHVPVAPH